MQMWMRDPLIPSGLRCYFEGCNMAKGCKRTKSLTVVVWCCLFMISLDCPDAWYNRILGSWTTGALGTAFVATGPGIAGNGYGNDYPKRFNCWPHTVRIWMLLLKSTKARLRKEVGGQFSSANQRSCCSYSLNWEFVTKSICLWNDVTWLHHKLAPWFRWHYAKLLAFVHRYGGFAGARTFYNGSDGLWSKSSKRRLWVSWQSGGMNDE